MTGGHCDDHDAGARQAPSPAVALGRVPGRRRRPHDGDHGADHGGHGAEAG